MTRQILKGDVYFAELGSVKGSEQGGARPVLVVQNDIGNRSAPTVIALPITTRKKPALPTHANLVDTDFLKENSIALAEQIRTLDKTRLGERIGRISILQMREVDNALTCALGLPVVLSQEEVANVIKTLCSYCKKNYEDAGYELRRLKDRRRLKSRCDFCNMRSGFDYEVVQ